MCCYESTFRAHTRGNINQFAKIPHLGFSNPEVLEKTDSLYIDLSAKKSSESREVSLGIVLDDDDENNLVGIDIDNTSNKLDLKQLVLSKIPAEKQTIAALFLELSICDSYAIMRPGTLKNSFNVA